MKEELNISYEGKHLKDGKIDIKEFAPSLLAFASILEETNKIINGDRAEIKAYISSDFENKCFKCKLSLESNLLESVKNLFGVEETLSIIELLELLGFIGELGLITTGAVIQSYIVYKTIEKGRKVRKITELKDGNVELLFEKTKTTKETTIKVSFNLLKFIRASWKKKWTVTKDFKEHFLPKGNIKYDIYGKKDNTINQECKENMLLEDKNLEKKIANQDPIKTNLGIRMLDYYGNLQWKFLFAGKTIIPDFSDEIKKQLQGIRKEVKYETKLPVELKISYEEDENGELIPETEKYTILEITGDLIQESKNLKLI